jgi:outer membrane immunogenic protein
LLYWHLPLRCSSAAYSADLLTIESPATYAPAAFDWNGFYVGVNGGFGGGTFEHPLEITDGVDSVIGSLDVTSGGFLGGAQAGFNWQMDNILIGVEGDIQASGIDGRVTLGITDATGVLLNPGDTINADAGTRLDWLATLRPRIGFVDDRFVVYGTGGLAFGHSTSSISADFNGAPIFDGEVENDRMGWTVGAGLEYALTDNVTFKTEYLYTDLGTENVLTLPLGGADFTLDSTVAFHTVRAGVNLQF